MVARGEIRHVRALGLYSLLAGEYGGKKTNNIAEWIMHDLHIPFRNTKSSRPGLSRARSTRRSWLGWPSARACAISPSPQSTTTASRCFIRIARNTTSSTPRRLAGPDRGTGGGMQKAGHQAVLLLFAGAGLARPERIRGRRGQQRQGFPEISGRQMHPAVARTPYAIRRHRHDLVRHAAGHLAGGVRGAEGSGQVHTARMHRERTHRKRIGRLHVHGRQLHTASALSGRLGSARHAQQTPGDSKKTTITGNRPRRSCAIS